MIAQLGGDDASVSAGCRDSVDRAEDTDQGDLKHRQRAFQRNFRWWNRLEHRLTAQHMKVLRWNAPACELPASRSIEATPASGLFWSSTSSSACSYLSSAECSIASKVDLQGIGVCVRRDRERVGVRPSHDRQLQAEVQIRKKSEGAVAEHSFEDMGPSVPRRGANLGLYPSRGPGLLLLALLAVVAAIAGIAAVLHASTMAQAMSPRSPTGLPVGNTILTAEAWKHLSPHSVFAFRDLFARLPIHDAPRISGPSASALRLARSVTENAQFNRCIRSEASQLPHHRRR